MNVPPRLVPPILVQETLARGGSKISLYEYDDVPYGSAYWPDVQITSTRRLMVGKSYTHFGAGDTLSRAESGAIIARVMKLPVGAATGMFADIPKDHWAAPFAEALYRAGVTRGCSSAPLRYCPDDQILREQFAILLARGLGLGASTLSFDDVSADVRPYAAAMVAAGLMEPCAPTRFCGTSPVMRRDAARTIARALVRPPY